MRPYAALILAAGMGTRMKSKLCKVLHGIAGRPMISYVVDAVRLLGCERIVVVVGHQAADVQKTISAERIEFAIQEPQLGTGHAVACAGERLRNFGGEVLILCGDIPLIRSETLQNFMSYHERQQSRVTVMTTGMDDPKGYGRIIRNQNQTIDRIVEEADANPDEKCVKEINTGIYLVNAHLLYSLVDRIQPENAQGEYYLTDIVAEAAKERIPVHACLLQDSVEATGINTRSELAYASQIIWNRKREDLMAAGVTLLDPASVYVDDLAQIGIDTVIHPCVNIVGATEIGEECVIESGVYIMNSKIGDRVHILQGSRLNQASVMDETSVGPMAHLRPEAMIGKNCRVGNFVEVKKTSLGEGSKASHLTYLGDSEIGKNVNIGCGTITCNYDGKNKHRTIIGDRCFVGSDVQFVAPVEIGEESLIGAGSTITKDVPPRNLAVSRSKQKSYPLREGQGPAKAKR
jgi:bifunctional UDP-N-acetylglucosamine pyrophosphorylase/glucosamine-1-phosphate N-acetyltransferase